MEPVKVTWENVVNTKYCS